MASIEYSPQAIEDLKELERRIKDDCGEKAASKKTRKLFTEISRLKQFPFSGVNLGGMIDVPTNYRYNFVEKNYVFNYIESQNVWIVRILDARQDFMYQLFGHDLKSTDEENN